MRQLFQLACALIVAFLQTAPAAAWGEIARQAVDAGTSTIGATLPKGHAFTRFRLCVEDGSLQVSEARLKYPDGKAQHRTIGKLIYMTCTVPWEPKPADVHVEPEPQETFVFLEFDVTAEKKAQASIQAE